MSDPQTAATSDAGIARDAGKLLPMTGVRVLDLGTFLAGACAASILGGFGAEVPHELPGLDAAAIADLKRQRVI